MRPRNDKIADRRPYLDDDAEIGGRKDVRGHGTAYRTTTVVAACALVLACTCMAVVSWGFVPSQSTAISLLTLVSPVGAQALRLGSLYAMHMPPHALMLARSWNVDVEIQGDCECERPYDLVTKILAKVSFILHLNFWSILLRVLGLGSPFWPRSQRGAGSPQSIDPARTST